MVLSENELQGVQKVSGLIPSSICSRHEEANLVSFVNMLSIILSNLDDTPDPVPEYALDVVKKEIIRCLCNRVLNFITQG
jgi:hypothetical protein